jgi:hypothetical protein
MNWLPTICLLIALAAGPVGPTYSQNATSRAVVTIESAYLDLAAADPVVRSDARMFLMGLGRADLPALQKIVESHLPATAGQAVALRDVVTCVYLSDEPAETDGKEGFLGIAPTLRQDSVLIPDPDHPGNVLAGVNFAARTPGSCAYRWLAEGDVILALGTTELQPVMSFADLSRRIRQIAPGTIVQMRLFRAGGIIEVRFPLDARPAAANDMGLFQALLDHRIERLETYWKKTFGPLVDSDMS